MIKSSEGERFYRVVDAIYRLHDDLFYIEDAVLRSTVAQVRLSQISAQSRLGAAIGVIVAGVPVLIAVSPLDWASAPVYWLIGAAVLLITFLGWQVREAHRAADALELAERLSEHGPLDRRLDFQLERINSHAHRIRILEDIIAEIEVEIGGVSDSDKPVLKRRLKRYGEIRVDCVKVISKVVSDSEAMLKAKLRSAEDHAVVLDWAKPYIS